MSNTALWHLHHLLWTLGDAARERAAVRPPHLPSGDVVVSELALDELRAMQKKVQGTFRLSAPSPPVSRVCLTTDACHSGGAAVWTLGPATTPAKVLDCDSWHWTAGEYAHINVLEMLALDRALESGWFPLHGDGPPESPGEVTLPWKTDSMVCLQAVHKGFSGSRQLGVPLGQVMHRCEAQNMVLAGEHVASADNIADRPSRLL